MKKALIIIIIAAAAVFLSSCRIQEIKALTMGSPIEKELINSYKVVFINNKEDTLKFTISDESVIEQVASIIGKSKAAENSPSVPADYTIRFYLKNGKERVFSYWMGVEQNKKDVNLKDDKGSYYFIPESMDLYIVNSTKMANRPQNFVSLYNAALSKCISYLEKGEEGDTIVGVDLLSDRRMRKYTMSYEDERMLSGIEVDGYTIQSWSKDSQYKPSYIVSFVTDIYSSEKAQITIDVEKVADQTRQTFVVTGEYKNDRTWILTIKEKKK